MTVYIATFKVDQKWHDRNKDVVDIKLYLDTMMGAKNLEPLRLTNTILADSEINPLQPKPPAQPIAQSDQFGHDPGQDPWRFLNEKG